MLPSSLALRQRPDPCSWRGPGLRPPALPPAGPGGQPPRALWGREASPRRIFVGGGLRGGAAQSPPQEERPFRARRGGGPGAEPEGAPRPRAVMAASLTHSLTHPFREEEALPPEGSLAAAGLSHPGPPPRPAAASRDPAGRSPREERGQPLEAGRERRVGGARRRGGEGRGAAALLRSGDGGSGRPRSRGAWKGASPPSLAMPEASQVSRYAAPRSAGPFPVGGGCAGAPLRRRRRRSPARPPAYLGAPSWGCRSAGRRFLRLSLEPPPP